MRGEYALVDLKLGASDTIAAAVGAGAALPTEGPGVTQSDAVQLVAGWALMRDGIMSGAAQKMKLAMYDAEGRFLGLLRPYTKKVPENVKQVVPIAGDGPLVAPVAGGGELGATWAIDLALALDQVTRRISKAKRGAAPPPGYVPVSDLLPAAGPAAIAIIAGGVALAVIGSVAAYRYFDPDLRKHVATVNAAGRAYEKRLEVKKATGTMPEPSPIELQAGKIVKDLAKEERNRSLLVGGGIAGGLGLGTLAIAALRRRSA